MADDGSFPLPDDLPVPTDDGAADHLPGTALPEISLPATDGSTVAVDELPTRTVVYVYPKTGRPDVDVIPEGWEAIPGARGCTPEGRGFRVAYDDLRAAGVEAVYGLSTQPSDYQREFRDRLDLPFEMVSDQFFELQRALDLPYFSIAGDTYLQRLTLVVADGRIEHVFYPVFPPDEHAAEVLAWVDANPVG